MDQIAKKAGFQGEIGTKTGYPHWQGRVGLRSRIRKPALLALVADLPLLASARWSQTSGPNAKGAAFYSYVTKTASAAVTAVRIDKWRKTGGGQFIPNHFRGIDKTMRPFQKAVKVIVDKFSPWNRQDCRLMHYIYDINGNNGKSFLGALIEYYWGGYRMKLPNDPEVISQTLFNVYSANGWLTTHKDREAKRVLLLDCPRYNGGKAENKMKRILAQLEEVLGGKISDWRNTHREASIAAPHMWITANIPPPLDALTHDRWRIYVIRGGKLYWVRNAQHLDPEEYEGPEAILVYMTTLTISPLVHIDWPTDVFKYVDYQQDHPEIFDEMDREIDFSPEEPPRKRRRLTTSLIFV